MHFDGSEETVSAVVIVVVLLGWLEQGGASLGRWMKCRWLSEEETMA
jgi:hypothetical protein